MLTSRCVVTAKFVPADDIPLWVKSLPVVMLIALSDRIDPALTAFWLATSDTAPCATTRLAPPMLTDAALSVAVPSAETTPFTVNESAAVIPIAPSLFTSPVRATVCPSSTIAALLSKSPLLASALAASTESAPNEPISPALSKLPNEASVKVPAARMFEEELKLADMLLASRPLRPIWIAPLPTIEPASTDRSRPASHVPPSVAAVEAVTPISRPA